jgi:CRP/FNR family cyclic AMP-dependent transcriptional regulator
MLHKNAKIDLIRSVPLFSNCSRRELAEIASLADEIDLPEGEALIREGSAAASSSS